MTIHLSENFKRLRRDYDLTQEQAAEIFGVSPQAVSRWECGASCPDITLLPIIADYFNVSMEELLGVGEARKNQQIAEILESFQDAINHGRVYDCIRIARAGVHDFPNNYALWNKLMYALFISADSSANIPEWKDNQEKYSEEIIDIGNKILTHCTDDDIRLEAKARLGCHYCEIGEIEKGRAVIETLPSKYFSREEQIRWAISGEEEKRYYGKKIGGLYCEMLMALISYVDPDDHEAVIAAFDSAEKIFRVIYNEDDYGDNFYDLAVWFVCMKAPAYLNLGREEEMFACLEKALEYSKCYSKMPDIYEHTSPFIDGLISFKTYERADSRSEMEIIVDDLSSEIYEDVSDKERLARLIEAFEELV